MSMHSPSCIIVLSFWPDVCQMFFSMSSLGTVMLETFLVLIYRSAFARVEMSRPPYVRIGLVQRYLLYLVQR